jgi:hypothetical protein
MDDMREMAQSPEHRRRFEKLLLLAAERGDADLGFGRARAVRIASPW